VKCGVSLVDQAGQSLGDIVEKIQSIDINIKAIANSVKEQSAGLQEINEAVIVIDQGTQQNAAMVEQTTASSHGLAKEAEALFELLSHFQLGASSAGTTAARQNPRTEPENEIKPTSRTVSPQHELVANISANFGGAATAEKLENWTEF